MGHDDGLCLATPDRQFDDHQGQVLRERLKRAAVAVADGLGHQHGNVRLVRVARPAARPGVEGVERLRCLQLTETDSHAEAAPLVAGQEADVVIARCRVR